jgi:hypothetical protein
MSSLRFSPLALSGQNARVSARTQRSQSCAETRQLVPADTRAWRSARVTAVRSHNVKQPRQHISFPQPIARGSLPISSTPMRGGRSADRRPDAAASGGRAITRHVGALARRPCALSGGTRAFRRSTMAILGPGSALPFRAFPPERSSSQPGRSAWRAGFHSARRRA